MPTGNAVPVRTWELCPASEAQGLLARGGLTDLLSPSELARFSNFPTEKRRLDWLAGRMAAKKAMRALEPRLAWTEIELLNDDGGRPFFRLPSGPGPFVSISHCARGGVCAISESGPVGIDFEPVVARGPAVVAMFVSAAEAAPLDQDAAVWQTRLWTAKEAVLKLLGLGLTCDPRDVRWQDATKVLELAGPARKRWLELGRPRLAVEHQVYEDCLVAFARCEGD
jgi:4'-phosphopantetheinyl transferase